LHRVDAGMDLTGLETDRSVLEEGSEVVLGVDLDEEDTLPLLSGEQCGRRGDRALADAALPGEEEQSTIEQR
jgi:hypothetical protein